MKIFGLTLVLALLLITLLGNRLKTLHEELDKRSGNFWQYVYRQNVEPCKLELGPERTVAAEQYSAAEARRTATRITGVEVPDR